MDATSSQVTPHAKRRWLAHVVWLAIVFAAFGGGLALGFRWCGMAWAGLTSTNSQAESFAHMRIALDALESDELAKLRHADAVLLHEALFKLGYLPRYVDCRPVDRSYLARANAWLDSHPFPHGNPLEDVRKRSATFCDNAPPAWAFP